MHFVSPYQNDGVAEIKLKKEMDVRIRLSELTDYKALHQDLDKHQINHYIDPVSYTHLDVYKRQGFLLYRRLESADEYAGCHQSF